jgi:hypothetical protein
VAAGSILANTGLAQSQLPSPAPLPQAVVVLGDAKRSVLGARTLAVPGESGCRYPDGPRGAYNHGFRRVNDGTEDWGADAGLRYAVELPDEREVELTFTVQTPGNEPGVAATVRVRGVGRRSGMLPWTAFAFQQARPSFLQFVKGLTVAARYPDGGAPGQIRLGDVSVVIGPSAGLSADVRGKSAPAGQTAEYAVRVSNCTDEPQAITLGFVRRGWEAMGLAVEPAALTLTPGESRDCAVRVTIPDRVPPGGHEEQTLQAIANGDGATAATLTFTTVRELPHPYVLHTPARWDEVRAKVKNYPWAQEQQDAFVKTADAWNVPEVARPPGNDPNDNLGPYLFRTDNEGPLLACGYSWQLTRNRAHAEKVATFLRRLSNPADGYPQTLRGCHQGLVQEGHFFQHIAQAYDMILDANVLTAADRAQIDATLRIFMETIDRASDGGGINNWNLSEVTGAFFCSLAMQDLVSAERFFAGPSGIKDQLGKGTLDDGWWYECTISYNVWCATEFCQAALAYEPFGVNFKNEWVPANFSTHVPLAPGPGGVALTPEEDARRMPFGMNPDIFGPVRRPDRTITDLWNGLLPFLDYRGVMFGVNDSTENKIAGGQPFEVAYYVYRDPRYAAIIKLGGGKRDLLYGVPDLPAKTPEEFRESAFADNVGLAMLRSQTPDRPIQEQIQAVLHYGTHGWAHGHFDRTDLLSLMRYGRSFWNPESVFYVYEPFMYKFYCQTSLNHNMVVVDEKMQEAKPGERILWHTGKLMQAALVETTARWSNPPYGGMVYDYVPVKTFAEKTWREGRFVPIPDDAPKYGSLTGFTEPIRQRRLMVVTDDYVLLADDAQGSAPHTFENLFQPKGFRSLAAAEKKFLRHDAQWNPDPVGGAQFVTDCDWYAAAAPAVAHFEERWGPGVDEEGSRSNANEPGALQIDVHSLWPLQQEIMVATAPEQHDVDKKLFYTVRGDGRTLAEGKFGAWILGQGDVDVPVEGVKQLELETKTEGSKKPTLFWGNARVITRAGQEVPLAQLPQTAANIVPAKVPGEDYFGGPVKIAGNAYAAATAAEPADAKQPGTVRVDLSGLDAVRFKAVVGSDYPPGPEDQRRKVLAVRTPDHAAGRFLTVIEPYATTPMVKSAVALDAGTVRVELTDGRRQEIRLVNFAAPGRQAAVHMTEWRAGQTVREETTSAGDIVPP